MRYALSIRHQPQTGTPIKNRGDGEQLVALTDETCVLLDAWLAEQRPDVTGEVGRDPLVVTSHGRISKSTIRMGCYRRRDRVLLANIPTIGIQMSVRRWSTTKPGPARRR